MATITITEMRSQLTNCEPYSEAPSWVDKVGRMPDSQVIAVWNNFNRRGYFARSKNIAKNKRKDPAPHQITMFEYMEDLPYADE